MLSRDLRGEHAAVVLRKGEILQPDHLGALQQVDWRELHLIEVEASDLHEDAAGQPEWFTSGTRSPRPLAHHLLQCIGEGDLRRIHIGWLHQLGAEPAIFFPNVVLPRILAGERVGSAGFVDLGHGGFLTRDMAFRFPAYSPACDRGEVPAIE